MESCADLCLLSCLLALAIAASICRLSAPVSRLAVDNALYLLVQFFLPREGRIEVVCFIGTVFWADEIHPDHIAKNLFQRQSLFFIHGKQKTGQHDKDHAERGCAGADMLLEQEKQRNADQRTAAEANKLPFGQIQKDLAFYCRQVFWYGYISHNVLL